MRTCCATRCCRQGHPPRKHARPCARTSMPNCRSPRSAASCAWRINVRWVRLRKSLRDRPRYGGRVMDTAKAPTVSIILPTFNRLKYLRRAVDSVFAQSFADWELIVADDGSDEATRAFLGAIALVPRVRVLWLSHKGTP